ncbi:hypothetical protein K9F62_20860 [Desulfovibrio sp. JY]|nr:hypothetical protein K9F62_20860 [Desulfovibrio sp. JY]
MKRITLTLAVLSLSVSAFAQINHPMTVITPTSFGGGIQNYCPVEAKMLTIRSLSQSTKTEQLSGAIMSISDYTNLGILLATLIAAIVAGLYTYFTYKMLDTMKKQYIDTNKPKMHVTIETDTKSSMFYLVIRNIGNGIASDVLFSIDKDFYAFSNKRDDHNIKTYRPFSNMMAYMPPGDEYVYYLDQAWNIVSDDKHSAEGKKPINPHTFNVSVSYIYNDINCIESYTIDLRNYIKTTKSPSRLIREFEKLNAQMEELVKKIK